MLEGINFILDLKVSINFLKASEKFNADFKQILHPLLLNTKIYYTQGGNIS